MQQFVFLCQEKANFPTSANASHLKGHVQRGGETFTYRAEVAKHGAEILKGHGHAADDGKAPWRNLAAKQKDRHTKNNDKSHKTARNNQFMHTKRTRI